MASAPAPAQDTREPGGAEGGPAESCRTKARCLKGSRQKTVNYEVTVLMSQ